MHTMVPAPRPSVYVDPRELMQLSSGSVRLQFLRELSSGSVRLWFLMELSSGSVRLRSLMRLSSGLIRRLNHPQPSFRALVGGLASVEAQQAHWPFAPTARGPQHELHFPSPSNLKSHQTVLAGPGPSVRQELLSHVRPAQHGGATARAMRVLSFEGRVSKRSRVAVLNLHALHVGVVQLHLPCLNGWSNREFMPHTLHGDPAPSSPQPRAASSAGPAQQFCMHARGMHCKLALGLPRLELRS